MSDTFYHDALLALAKDNVRSGRLDPHDGSARADNPLCGDRVTLDVTVSNGRVTDAAQKTRGCILTKAAAAMITRHATGQTLNGASELTEIAKRFLAGDDAASDWPEFAHFAPVRDVASRHDCILIAFKALEDALLDASNRETNP